MEWFKLCVYIFSMFWLISALIGYRKPTMFDFMCLTLSYSAFGLAWVIEGFIK